MKNPGYLEKQQILGISFVSFNTENISISQSALIFFLLLFILIVIIVYNSHTKFGFSFRKRIRFSFNKDSNKHKNLARILFIDDKDIPIAQTFEDEHWVVKKVRDAKIDDQEVKEANIIFVDWKGVGRKINSEEEGFALVNSIKKQYGYEKYVILYSSREYLKPEGTLADDWINKGSPFSRYLETIQKACFSLFG